jgi:hypothetical protein
VLFFSAPSTSSQYESVSVSCYVVYLNLVLKVLCTFPALHTMWMKHGTTRKLETGGPNHSKDIALYTKMRQMSPPLNAAKALEKT